MSLYLGDNLISGTQIVTDKSERIGQIIPSTIPLTDAGLHLLDGALIDGSGIYSAFVDYIAGLVSTYPDLFVTESDWQTAVSTYGVCGKFVYDSVNNTVRLPKITGIVEGTTDLTALGDLVEAGLPNITGHIYYKTSTDSHLDLSGAFQLVSYNSGVTPSGTNKDENVSADFNASASNPIYGNSTTVQPQTIKVLYYIVIATSTKTDIQVDIDEIATDLNGKADVDLSNMSASSSAKNTITTWMMPDYANGITCPTSLGTEKTYTAPTNGFFAYTLSGYNRTSGWIFINDVLINWAEAYNNPDFVAVTGIAPVTAGDVIRYYSGYEYTTYSMQTIVFFPLKGVN